MLRGISLCMLFSVVSITATKSVPNVGIKIEGGKLKKLLERSGHVSRQTWGAEKLDMLVWMADQVKANIEGQVKMKLKLQELINFLTQEGMQTKKGDSKHAVMQLLALRRRERERLGVFEPEDDESFEKKLKTIPERKVSECFNGLVPVGKPFDAGFHFDVNADSSADHPAGNGVVVIGEDDASDPEQMSLMSMSHDAEAAEESVQTLAKMSLDDVLRTTQLLIGWEDTANDEGGSRPTLKEQKAEVASAVDRIMNADHPAEILGEYPETCNQEFRSLVLLLHPDRGIVQADDEQASTALRRLYLARHFMQAHFRWTFRSSD